MDPNCKACGVLGMPCFAHFVLLRESERLASKEDADLFTQAKDLLEIIELERMWALQAHSCSCPTCPCEGKKL